MIRIQKVEAPEILLTTGKKQRQADCTRYSRNPKAYRSGVKTFEFKASIYGHYTVKQALIDSQHQKCCFCEQLVGNDGDVEHFRPKQAYKQAKGEPLVRPGYYWLAYEWENLFLACPACNQRYKQNLFPLVDPTKRCIDHKSINQEQPFFIDPGSDDPEALIGFNSERAYAKGNNQRAQSTIESLQLNRRNLSEARLKYLKPLKILHQLIQHAAKHPEDKELQQFAQESKQVLEEYCDLNSPFTSMVRAARQNDFNHVPG